MNLYDEFCEVLNEARDVAGNTYLLLLAAHIKDIEIASKSEPTLANYCQKMAALIRQQNFAQDGNLVSEFAQLFGEAHFAYLCHERGVSLTRIPEQKNKKTPDFLHSTSPQNVYFEVKTLSVVNGGSGINDDLLNSLDAQIDIEEQLLRRNSVAVGVAEAQPYGQKPYDEGSITGVINVLIEKTRQNIKSAQYASPNTFLVLNLCLLPPATTENKTLRPAYCDGYLFPKAITGDLWMLAFAKPGMLVHASPECEGKPCIESTLQKVGILADTDYSNISGLLVVVYPLSGKPDIYGLYRSAEHDSWTDDSTNLAAILNKLASDNWNDETDSNGWQLNGAQLAGMNVRGFADGGAPNNANTQL